MSHVVTIKTEVKNIGCLTKACSKLNLAEPKLGSHRMYSGSEQGYGVNLKDWRYPVVINEKTGEIKYDNFGGSWGNQLELDGLVQAYQEEVVNEFALNSGYMVQRETLPEGEIRLTLSSVGG